MKRCAPPLGELLEVGRITRAHGLRGELRVKPHWEGSDALHEASEVWLLGEGSPERREVRGARPSDKGVLLWLRGIDDRDAAQALAGRAVAVSRDVLPAPREGEYYLIDLVGAEVMGPAGRIGTVVDVRTHPTVDVAIVELDGGGRAEQILGEPWVESVDVVARRVVLSSTDGLIV